MPKLALLAGGLATRMRPATLHLAKSMLPVAGEPFLGHQLRLLAEQGITEIVICCGYLENQLREYAGDGSRWGCSIEYVSDGELPLGTGGALRNALPRLGGAFMVMYGDSYLRAPLLEVWQVFLREGRAGLMTVFANAGRWDTSNIEFTGGRLLRYSKRVPTPAMQHIDYGLTCLRAEALLAWPEGVRFDMADLMTHLLERNQLAALEVHERFYEIGSPHGLAQMRDHLASLPASSTGANG